MKNSKFKLTLLATIICSSLFISCGDDDSTEPETQQDQTANATLPASVSGQVVNFTFTAAQPGAPYTLNQEVKVTFSSSGMFFLDSDPAANNGDEVNVASFTTVGNEIVWADAANDYSYALSFKADSSINELNVSQTSTSTFLGSFEPIVALDASLIGQFAGTYNVTQTIAGAHTRNTVIIDANGNIDFDTNKQINTTEFARIDNKLDCCDAISVDTKPYPTTPYGRIIMYTDSTNSTLTGIDYRPDHPGLTNRVEVKF